MSWLELIAAGLGIVAVWLTVRQNPWCWPIGLLMVLLYAWLFYDWRLYSNLLCSREAMMKSTTKRPNPTEPMRSTFAPKTPTAVC